MKAKIINEETKEVSVAIGSNPPDDYTEMDVEHCWNGNWYVAGYAPEKPAPTMDEQKRAREIEYAIKIDHITAHIQRLRDEEQKQEIIDKINELIKERQAIVYEIKRKYPYPVGVENETENSENINTTSG